jgi:nicotinate-nucleotide pyrophosphorylase (carboxylating)
VLDPAAHRSWLEAALREDVGRGDVTTDSLVPASKAGVADLVAREAGVVAGVGLLEPLFRLLDPAATVEVVVPDGSPVAAGGVVAVLRARARALLAGERTALNLVRRLSGIATISRRFVDAVRGLPVEVLDTRKTAPGWRDLEKHAVRCGGASNHRLRLDDAAMVKENHLVEAFGRKGPAAVAEAVRRVRAAAPKGTVLHVEVEDDAELRAAVEAGADVVMLDGFGLEALRAAVAWTKARPPPRPRLEATGGVTLSNVRAIAETGVDRVSVGAITHSAPALDLSVVHRVGP